MTDPDTAALLARVAALEAELTEARAALADERLWSAAWQATSKRLDQELLTLKRATKEAKP